jgi:hypothetical protein
LRLKRHAHSQRQNGKSRHRRACTKRTIFHEKLTSQSALTAFPDSAWALQPVLRQVTLLAGIRADRATFITFPTTCFRAISGLR